MRTILSDVRPNEVLDILNMAIGKIRASGCECYADIGQLGTTLGKDIKQTTIGGEESKLSRMCSLDDLTKHKLKDVANLNEISVYFYVFGSDVDPKEILPLIQRCTQLYYKAHSVKGAVVHKYSNYKDSQGDPYFTKLDEKIQEIEDETGRYYYIEGVQAVCIRISAHPIVHRDKKRFMDGLIHNAFVRTFYDPCTVEEAKSNINKALLQVGGKVSIKKKNGKKTKESSYINEEFEEYNILDKTCKVLRSECATSVMIGNEYFRLENFCRNCRKDLEFAISILESKIPNLEYNLKIDFMNDALKNRIKIIKEYIKIFKDHYDWIKYKAPYILSDCAEACLKRNKEEERKITEQYKNGEYSGWVYGLEKQSYYIKSLENEVASGHLTDPIVIEDLRNLRKYSSAALILSRRKRNAHIIKKAIMAKKSIFDRLDTILSSTRDPLSH